MHDIVSLDVQIVRTHAFGAMATRHFGIKTLWDTSAPISRHQKRDTRHFDTSAVIEEKPRHFNPGQFRCDTLHRWFVLNFGTNFVVPKCLVAEVSYEVWRFAQQLRRRHLPSAQNSWRRPCTSAYFVLYRRRPSSSLTRTACTDTYCASSYIGPRQAGRSPACRSWSAGWAGCASPRRRHSSVRTTRTTTRNWLATTGCTATLFWSIRIVSRLERRRHQEQHGPFVEGSWCDVFRRHRNGNTVMQLRHKHRSLHIIHAHVVSRKQGWCENIKFLYTW